MNTESMGTGIPGAKVPIYELAKELGIVNKDLVTKIRALGIEAKNHMSRLEPEDVLRIRRAIDKERQENTVQERLSDTVIRRRAKDGSMLRPPAPPPPPAPTPPPA
ncbi:MAG TPA: translation initiation factor IF-2 N-terminal domain-containing protein, partial [Pseudomonadota bacterium]|nr:translation initiation factor IF-2 N-terminal domain-containing protein [Pseudomonadota bacterium]